MQLNHATTPYGRRPFSLALMTSQVAAKACPAESFADKWQIFKNIKKAKRAFRLSDRPLALLQALLSFHPEQILTGGAPIVVFPSNRMLSERANGMEEDSIRRGLKKLVGCGIILRRDSPNGKRYARKGPDGKIIGAFGFDLLPLVARAGEFQRLAAEEAERAQQLRARRDLITISRRDIDKMIATGVYEGLSGDWPSFSSRFDALNGRLPRKAEPEALFLIARDLGTLADEIRAILEVETFKMHANDTQNAGHIQDSNPTFIFESEHGLPISHEATIEPPPQTAVSPSPSQQAQSTPTKPSFPLAMVLEACPDIVEQAPEGIKTWRGLIATAEQVRPWLGISPSAWQEATDVLGQNDAAIVLAAILQRGEAIACAGGYLRRLTQKASAGTFSLGPVLMALIRANLRKRAEKLRA